MHNLKLLVNPNWSYSPETLNLVKIGFFFVPRDLEIWRMTLKNNMAPLLYYVKLYAPFQTIRGFKLELQSRNSQFGSKLAIFFLPRYFEIWRMTLKNNRAHIWNYVKLYA